jgi:hypothetical protein
MTVQGCSVLWRFCARALQKRARKTAKADKEPTLVEDQRRPFAHLTAIDQTVQADN